MMEDEDQPTARVAKPNEDSATKENLAEVVSDVRELEEMGLLENERKTLVNFEQEVLIFEDKRNGQTGSEQNLHKIKSEDKTPGEDFFERQIEKEEEKYGEIEGMKIVASEDGKSKEKLTEEEENEETDGISTLNKDEIGDKIGDEAKDEPKDESKIEPKDEVKADVEDESKLDSDSTLSSKDIRKFSVRTLSSAAQVRDLQQHSSMSVRGSEVVRKVTIVESDVANIFQSSVSIAKSSESRQYVLEEEEEQGETLIRQSIYYDIKGRLSGSEHDIDTLFDLSKPEHIIDMDDSIEGIEEESEPTVIGEESYLYRKPYYEKYEKLSENLTANRIKNNVLQKLIAIYLKRRKVENFLRSEEPPLDVVLNYGRKIDAYEQLMNINATQHKTLSSEVNTLKERKIKKQEDLKHLFTAMQTQESNIGHGLIYAKTGKEIPDKLVERFLSRQSNQITQVSNMRLQLIRLKGMVQNKFDAIDRLDILENNLHLSNFEQLKTENRSHYDKMEEQEEELTKLRYKCQTTIQILAHLREKSATMNADLADLTDEYSNAMAFAKDVREQQARLKQEKMKYREMQEALKEDSGLLNYPDLLRDMENSQKKIEHEQYQLDKYKKNVNSQMETIRILRRKMEIIIENKKRGLMKSTRVTTDRCKDPIDYREVSIYARRPTLQMPIIQPKAFNGLVKIKPPPTVLSKKRR